MAAVPWYEPKGWPPRNSATVGMGSAPSSGSATSFLSHRSANPTLTLDEFTLNPNK